MVKSFFPPHI